MKSRPVDGAICDPGCHFCSQHLHSYLEGEADPFTAKSLERHIEACRRCREELRELEEERIGAIEAMVACPPLSPSFSSRVIQEIRRTEAEERTSRKLAALRRFAISLGAVAALAVAAALVGRLVLVDPAPSARTIASATPAAFKVEGRVPPLAPAKAIEVAAAIPASVTAAPAGSPGKATMVLSEWFEISEEIFPGRTKPCLPDLNHDGQANPSDAAHLFMLAVQPYPADLTRTFEDEVAQDCAALSCQI